MCNDTLNGCNDYSLKTANTGISTLDTANPLLTGKGIVSTVFTAGASGSIVKSVIVKATAPVTTGMVRLFVQKNADGILYRELPIQTTPDLANTPIPSPVLPLYETMLVGDLMLEAGDKLLASTQIANQFTVVAEGLDWDYPSTLPPVCCNFKQVVAVTEAQLVTEANPRTDGGGAIVKAFAAPGGSNGTLVKCITIKALQSTSINGMIRLFLSADGGTTYNLIREIQVPQTIQSGFEPSYKQVINMNFNLQADMVIGVSTQNPDGFAVTVEGESWSYPI